MRLLSIVAVVFLAAWPSRAAAKVLIAPVHDDAGVGADLATELEEAVRTGLMQEAPALDLRVMSHRTLVSSLTDLAARPGLAVQLPCTSAECDAAVGRMLGTQYSVTTRLTKIGGKYLAVIKILTDADDGVRAMTGVESESYGVILQAVPDEAAKLARQAMAATAPGVTKAPLTSAPAPVDDRRDQPRCRSSIDCAGGGFCKDRGDGVKVCMDNGITGDACRSSIDCGAGRFCKDRGDGRKACMGDGQRGDPCNGSIDCGSGLFCKQVSGGTKVCK